MREGRDDRKEKQERWGRGGREREKGMLMEQMMMQPVYRHGPVGGDYPVP